MFSVYKRSKESDSLAYSSAIICLSYIRIALFFPLVYFCCALIHPGLMAIFAIPIMIITWVYTKKKAPPKERCITNKKYKHVPCPRLLMFIILFSFGLWGFFGMALVGKYIIYPLGLEGCLIRFFE